MKVSLVKVGVVTCLVSGLLYGQAAPGFVYSPIQAKAEESVNVNYSFQEINRLLTEEAIAANIPPEVVKAIAKKESDWRQFDENGEPFESKDKGYGIMQITNFAGFEGKEELIKTDIRENIKAGVKILDSMYNRGDLPKVQNADRHDLESWYFPVMAYNGIKPVNSPLVQATGERNEGKEGAYQEQVFAFMEEMNLLKASDFAFRQFPFTTADFDYVPGSSENIKFKVKEYTVQNPHQSAYFFEKDDQVVVIGDKVKLRPEPGTHLTELNKLDKGTRLGITGPFEYDKGIEGENTFVWYPVQSADMKYKGYIASSYLKEASADTEPATKFTDVGRNYQDAVDFVVSKGIKGTSETTFGTSQYIKRVDAAVMLARAAGLDIENAPDSGFTDVRPTAVKEVNALKAAGITDGYTKTTLNSEAFITRGELAIWIERAFKLQAASDSMPFNDVGERYTKSVAALVNNEVTKGTSPVTFGTGENAKRGDYAIFLYRAANAK